MRDAQFETLRLELLKGGVAHVYVERTIAELEEHYADLEADARAAGLSAAEAAAAARTAIGSDNTIAAAVRARPELLTWDKRWPRVAGCVRSATVVAEIPGVPLVYCIEHRPELARWGAAFGVATAFVSGMLTTLNWLIFVA